MTMKTVIENGLITDAQSVLDAVESWAQEIIGQGWRDMTPPNQEAVRLRCFCAVFATLLNDLVEKDR